MNRKTRNLYLKTPLRMWLMAGSSSIALALVVVMISTRTVHADARLSLPVALTVTAVPPVAAPAPQALTAQQTAVQRGDRLRGIASWYGGVFNGRKTASGERYNMYALTACHPTLPFGSVVRVVNTSNDRSVIVRINDRGDLLHADRIIDLSYGAAQQLAMAKDGLAKVDLQVISLGKSDDNN